MSIEQQLKVLEMMFERANALNTYWNIYIAVGLGFLGLLAQGKDFAARPLSIAVLCLGFLAFAAVNLEAMYSTNAARSHLQSLLVNTPLAAGAYAVRPSQPWQLLSFHIAMDVLVLSAIWLVPWYTEKREGRRGTKRAA